MVAKRCAWRAVGERAEGLQYPGRGANTFLTEVLALYPPQVPQKRSVVAVGVNLHLCQAVPSKGWAMANRIGEFLVRIGKMTPDQVEQVLQLQGKGDSRSFGEIALALHLVGNDSIKRFIDYLEKKQSGST